MPCAARSGRGDRRAASVISSRSEPKSVVGARSARRFRPGTVQKATVRRARALHGNAPRRRRQRERARHPGCHPDPNPGSIRYARARTLRRVHAASRRPGVTAKTHRAFKFSSGTARQPRTNRDASAPDLTATGAEARSDRISHVSRHLSHPVRRAVRRRRRGNEPVRRRVRRWARRASDATASETGQPNAVAGGIADGRRRQTPLELERVARGVRGRPRWGERAAVFRVWKATRSGKTGCARWAIGAVDV